MKQLEQQNQDLQKALQTQEVNATESNQPQPPSSSSTVAPPSTQAPPPPAPPPTQPANNHSRIPVPRLEKFRGSGSIIEWCTTFLIYVSLHELTESTAIQMLPFYLTAVAHQWFMHLSPTCKTTLETVGRPSTNDLDLGPQEREKFYRFSNFQRSL